MNANVVRGGIRLRTQRARTSFVLFIQPLGMLLVKSRAAEPKKASLDWLRRALAPQGAIRVIHVIHV